MDNRFTTERRRSASLAAIGFLVSWTMSAHAAPPGKAVTNSLGMKLISIPAGEFVMGAPEREVSKLKEDLEKELSKEEDETTEQQAARVRNLETQWEVLASETHRRRVVLTRPFFLGAYEVTQKEFSSLMEWNPSAHSAHGAKKGALAGTDTNRFPVERVTWEDAVEFCRQLSSLSEEVEAGRTYRLPTEAEWEYACRAGTTTAWYWGQTDKPASDYAWSAKNSGNRTHPVGEKKPNPWGLYDMSGNVAEWCGDWFDPAAGGTAVCRDPAGPSSGAERILRGGSGVSQLAALRSAARSIAPPDTRSDFRGFRVACDVQPRPLRAEPVAKVDSGYRPGIGFVSPETRLKEKRLTSQASFFVLPEDAQLVRSVAGVSRIRVACFSAQKECAEAQRQLERVQAVKAEAVKARIMSRNYITYSSYSAGWREIWAGRRARDNATDAILLADMSKEDVQHWRNDARADFESDVALFSQRCQDIREMSKKMLAEYARLSEDGAVKQALAELSRAVKFAYRLGPTPAALTAIQKLDTEESKFVQLKRK